MTSETKRMNAQSLSSTTSSLSLAEEEKARENQVKFCQNRVGMVQKHYGHFCETLGSMTRKIARMRDKGDILAKQMKEYADADTLSHSTTMQLKKFAENLSAIQDYRHAEITRMEKKVVEPLSKYGDRCKLVKKGINKEKSALSREVKQKTKLEKARNKRPGDAHYLSQVETELQKASSEVNIGSEALNSEIKTFEKEKVTDLKRVLVDFVSIEMMFHAKALEYYSRCFENLALIDEDLDVEGFSRKLTLTTGPKFSISADPSNQGTMTTTGTATGAEMSTFASSSEYTSGSYTYTMGSTTMGSTTMGSTGSSAEKRVRIQTQSMYADDDDDDDYEDEDDESDTARR